MVFPVEAGGPLRLSLPQSAASVMQAKMKEWECAQPVRGKGEGGKDRKNTCHLENWEEERAGQLVKTHSP